MHPFPTVQEAAFDTVQNENQRLATMCYVLLSKYMPRANIQTISTLQLCHKIYSEFHIELAEENFKHGWEGG